MAILAPIQTLSVAKSCLLDTGAEHQRAHLGAGVAAALGSSNGTSDTSLASAPASGASSCQWLLGSHSTVPLVLGPSLHLSQPLTHTVTVTVMAVVGRARQDFMSVLRLWTVPSGRRSRTLLQCN